jgi:hypothetical protein
MVVRLICWIFVKIFAPNDVATFAALCALATFDRQELKAKVMDSPDFKQFLELDPNAREVIYCFYSSKYYRCFEVLNSMKVSKGEFSSAQYSAVGPEGLRFCPSRIYF